MSKADLLEKISSGSGVSKSQAESVLNSFFDTVRQSARSGDKVGWPGFGSFSATQRSARTGRNPQTGAPVAIAASTAMKFTAAQGLKDFFRGGGTKKAAAKKGSAARRGPASKSTAKKGPAKKAAKGSRKR